MCLSIVLLVLVMDYGGENLIRVDLHSCSKLYDEAVRSVYFLIWD